MYTVQPRGKKDWESAKTQQFLIPLSGPLSPVISTLDAGFSVIHDINNPNKTNEGKEKQGLKKWRFLSQSIATFGLNPFEKEINRELNKKIYKGMGKKKSSGDGSITGGKSKKGGSITGGKSKKGGSITGK